MASSNKLLNTLYDNFNSLLIFETLISILLLQEPSLQLNVSDIIATIILDYLKEHKVIDSLTLHWRTCCCLRHEFLKQLNETQFTLVKPINVKSFILMMYLLKLDCFAVASDMDILLLKTAWWWEALDWVIFNSKCITMSLRWAFTTTHTEDIFDSVMSRILIELKRVMLLMPTQCSSGHGTCSFLVKVREIVHPSILFCKLILL